MAFRTFTSRPAYLAPLSGEQLDLLFQQGDTATAAKGTVIVEQGREQDRLFFLLSGRVNVRIAQGNATTELAELRPGESFGEMSVFDPGPASASVVATEKVEYWSIGRAKLDAFFNAQPDIAARLSRALVRELAQRLRVVNANLPARTTRVAEGWW
jgi:CRP-like cAMP-binding protein